MNVSPLKKEVDIFLNSLENDGFIFIDCDNNMCKAYKISNFNSCVACSFSEKSKENLLKQIYKQISCGNINNAKNFFKSIVIKAILEGRINENILNEFIKINRYGESGENIRKRFLLVFPSLEKEKEIKYKDAYDIIDILFDAYFS